MIITHHFFVKFKVICSNYCTIYYFPTSMSVLNYVMSYILEHLACCKCMLVWISPFSILVHAYKFILLYS